MPATAEIEQLTIDQNHDHVSTCVVFNTAHKSVVEVLKSLNLTNETRDSDGEYNPRHDLGWRNGWYKRRLKENRKVLRFVVPVGCSCSRDCCGHLCGLEHEMTMMGKFLVVITNRSYNY